MHVENKAKGPSEEAPRSRVYKQKELENDEKTFGERQLFKVPAWHIQDHLDLPSLNIKKEPRDCPVTSFQLGFKKSKLFLRGRYPGSVVLTPNSTKEAVFYLWASYKLSFEETVPKKDFESPDQI